MKKLLSRLQMSVDTLPLGVNVNSPSTSVPHPPSSRQSPFNILAKASWKGHETDNLTDLEVNLDIVIYYSHDYIHSLWHKWYHLQMVLWTPYLKVRNNGYKSPSIDGNPSIVRGYYCYYDYYIKYVIISFCCIIRHTQTSLFKLFLFNDSVVWRGSSLELGLGCPRQSHLNLWQLALYWSGRTSA